MSDMFNGCSSLTSLNLSNFNTTKVIEMTRMFSNCSSLISLNISNFNTNKTKLMENMFQDINKKCKIECLDNKINKIIKKDFFIF